MIDDVNKLVSRHGSWNVLVPSLYLVNPVRLTNHLTRDVREAMFHGETVHKMMSDGHDPEGCRLCRWMRGVHLDTPISHVVCESCHTTTYRDYIYVSRVEVLLPRERFATPYGQFVLEPHWVPRSMFFCSETCKECRLELVPFDLEFQELTSF